MATFTSTMPDARVEAFVAYLGAEAVTAEERLTVVTDWVQALVNTELWNMARQEAIAAVADPTL
jgi:hypothetical protein